MSATNYAQELAEIGELIEKATDASLHEPEWHLNLLICDTANSNAAMCDSIVRALHQKLQSGSPRTSLMTLILAETLVKNGSTPVHTQVGSRAFLQEVAGLTDGSMGFDVQNKALELIKQWADAFGGSSLTAFQDTYRMLKIQGVAFPDVENDVPVFTPPTSVPSGSMASAAPASSASRPSTREQQIAKLHSDLRVVSEKMELYRDLKARGETTTEAMEDVLDFLRQCQPRMNTLIEGGIMGKLDERTLEDCLNVSGLLHSVNLAEYSFISTAQVNDNLIKALDDAASIQSSGAAQGDLISFESPKRQAAAQPDLLGDFGEMSLNSTHAPPAPLRTTMNSVNDGTSFL
ncbi:hypothetical protein Poli38472_005559 [Pythium oligandrum]|uniref:VHS domain-containing protein n=1 Tax=Pythium oligandrum TaxID=41045 RepID=A0A8K1FHN9_PYTOL|nr:hypothetical protein Poli38472_005559 [Pythium oligandrum]|eukprot:TMW62941.1 hypothetical protein Poli38472_005559 [Pythium oligandrum]